MFQKILATWSPWELAAAAAAILFLLWLAGRMLFGRKQQSAHLTRSTCSSCGWSGTVSQIAARCPQCNKPIRS
jgi:hypothetical protein